MNPLEELRSAGSAEAPALPPGFTFSQQSLQDFLDCRRRFQLRFLMNLAWPAIETEPVLEHERFLQQGARFHRLVQQQLLGLDPADLRRRAQAILPPGWWESFSRLDLLALTGFDSLAAVHPEVSLAGSLSGFRLAARFDLLAVSGDGSLAVIDWKTSQRRPPRPRLAERIQTRLYCFLAAQAGARLVGLPTLQPEALQMIYWFAAFPDQPERFQYNASQYQADQDYLSGLIAWIARLRADEFPLTEREELCATCPYRSLCDRGLRAGEEAEMDDALDYQEFSVEFDFDQIAEIQF